MRALQPSNTSYMTKATNYAYNNLLGWEYSALALASSNTKTNCATLVWKAYNGVGQNILGRFNPSAGNATVLPSDLDLFLNGVANVAWSNYSWYY